MSCDQDDSHQFCGIHVYLSPTDSNLKCNKLMMMPKEVEGLWHKHFSGASEVEALAQPGVEPARDNPGN